MSDDKTSEDNWHAKIILESLIHFGTLALKFCFLTNGLAILSLLTFVGNNPYFSNNIKIGFYFYLAGLVSVSISGILAYFTQLRLYNESMGFETKQLHHLILYCAMGFVIFSILFFCRGSYLVISNF
jgi:hypothetical protein